MLRLKSILLFVFSISYLGIIAQIKIGDNPTSIGSSSLLELESTDKALVIPRIANTTSITTPVSGMVIYDLSAHCIKLYRNGAWSSCLAEEDNTIKSGSVSSLDCAGATSSPSSIAQNEAYTGIINLNYSGGDGNFYSALSIPSSGVTGLTATLQAGAFNFGTGTLNFTLSGTPTTAGTANFAITIGGQSCTIALTVAAFRSFEVLVHNQTYTYYPGGSSMPYLDDKLLNSANFGASGTYVGVPTLTYSSALAVPHSITASVLADYDVYIVSYQPQTNFSASETAAIKNWVDNDGGVLIVLEDGPNYDAVGTAFGIPISGTTGSAWTINPPNSSHAIFSGVFGTLTSITGTGTFGDYAINSNFTLLSYYSTTSKPTIYSYNSGNAMFIADEGVLRVSASVGSGIGTGQADILWGNIMAWAFDQVP